MEKKITFIPYLKRNGKVRSGQVRTSGKDSVSGIIFIPTINHLIEFLAAKTGVKATIISFIALGPSHSNFCVLTNIIQVMFGVQGGHFFFLQTSSKTEKHSVSECLLTERCQNLVSVCLNILKVYIPGS